MSDEWGKNHPLPDFVDAFAPLRIMELRMQGGPTEEDWNRMRAFGPDLAAKGDLILFRDRQTEGLVEELLFAIAVLSFCPGGIKIFGKRYEGRPGEWAAAAKENGETHEAA